MNRLLPSIALLVALALPSAAAAEIYVYVDQNGVSHYTNAPTDSRYKPANLNRLNTEPRRSISAPMG